MVAFSTKTLRGKKKLKNSSVNRMVTQCVRVCSSPSAECWQGKVNPRLLKLQNPERQSTQLLSCNVCFASLALNRLLAALCEENTRCCMWSLFLAARCHGNTNQTAAWTSGVSKKRESGAEMNARGQPNCQSSRMDGDFTQAWRGCVLHRYSKARGKNIYSVCEWKSWPRK